MNARLAKLTVITSVLIIAGSLLWYAVAYYAYKNGLARKMNACRQYQVDDANWKRDDCAYTLLLWRDLQTRGLWD